MPNETPMLVDGHGENVTETVVAIEYHRGKPFAVQTREVCDNARRTGRDADDRFTSCCQGYDFEWCRTNGQLYWHQSSAGGSADEFHVNRFAKPVPAPAKLWLAPGVRAVEYAGRDKVRNVSDASLLKRGYRRIADPLDLRALVKASKAITNPFDVGDGDTECHYCKHCNDWMPSGDGDWLCDHVRWCDQCGWWVYDKTHVSLDSHDGKPTVHEMETADV